MSRFIRKIGTIEYSYGYDRPLQEYFFEKSDSNLITKDNDEGYIFQISSHMSFKPHPETPNKMGYNRGEILNIIEKEEKLIKQTIVLSQHKEAIAMDQQF